MTPDSFSDGGRHFDTSRAIEAGHAMHKAGADIIDVGGESTRPGADPVPLEEELRRSIPVVQALAKAGIPVSIDTMKAAVMQAALDAGAAMLNDVSGLLADADSMAVAARSTAQIVLMHMPGDPRTMQGMAEYGDVVEDVLAALAERIGAAKEAGIGPERLIVDPGIGFGKGREHNQAILKNLERFHELGVAVMLGASRKSFIPSVAGPAAADQRLGGSLALALRGAEAGVAWVRVHDVPETVQAVKVWQAIRADRNN